MTERTDRELLLLIHADVDAVRTDVNELRQLLLGNGQPGVLHRLTAVETRVDERTKRTAGLSGGLGALGGLIVAMLSRWLGL